MVLNSVKPQIIGNFVSQYFTSNEITTLIVCGSALIALKWIINSKYSWEVKYDNGSVSFSCNPN